MKSVIKSLRIPDGAKPAELPALLPPQLATLVEEAPSDEDWLYEIKFDGYRMLARIDHGDVRLFTRNGYNWTDKLAGLAQELAKLKISSCWLDGEIVVLGPEGTPDFGALQNSLERTSSANILYFIFDIPYYAGYDLREAALVERRALLARLLSNSASDRVKYSEDFAVSGSDMLQGACSMGLEGVIGKRRHSRYVSGRSSSWIKLKCSQRQEFVIVGYTDSPNKERGIGALLLAAHDDEGKLQYAGRVGTGFNAVALKMLKDKLSPLAADKSPLAATPKDAKGNWVLPKLVAEVSFAEWTREGRVRHAVFQGLRSDKQAEGITREISTRVDRDIFR